MAKTTAFPQHAAKSLSDYTALTMQIRRTWESRSDVPDPWFRGLCDVRYALQPSWYRLGSEAEGVDEYDLLDEFERRAPLLLERERSGSTWEWYFLMQHYGLPTRLLDWSESSLVGLYFAVGDWKGKGGEPSHEWHGGV